MDTPSADRLRLKDLIGRPAQQHRVPAAKLQRLAQLAKLAGPANAHIEVLTDASGRHWLQGSVAAAVEAECQRCLEPVSTQLTAQFRLWLLSEKAEARIKAEGLETLQSNDVRLIKEGMIDMVALLEDELLLELPEQPCQDLECPRMPVLSFPAQTDRGAGTEAKSDAGPGTGTEATTDRRRPFADLRERMTKAGTQGAEE